MKKQICLIVFYCFVFYGFSQEVEKDCACCTDNHRSFDFWLGSWEVYNPDGNQAGSNLIETVQDACVIRENWTSANGDNTGTSYNFYNAQKNRWEQLWIDNNGQSLHLTGGVQEGSMVLSSAETLNREGEKIVNKITWTPNKDGTVRQFWEVHKIKEDKWTVVFDGLYKKVKK